MSASDKEIDMNVNLKLSFTDEQRNLIKRRLVGKDVKALATRNDIKELVDGFVQSMLEEEQSSPAPAPKQEFDQRLVPEQYRDKPLQWQMGWFRGRYLIKPFRA